MSKFTQSIAVRIKRCQYHCSRVSSQLASVNTPSPKLGNVAVHHGAPKCGVQQLLDLRVTTKREISVAGGSPVSVNERPISESDS